MEVERPPWAFLHLARGAWECCGRRVKGGWPVKGQGVVVLSMELWYCDMSDNMHEQVHMQKIINTTHTHTRTLSLLHWKICFDSFWQLLRSS